jgi:hypothetical protein
MSNFLSDNNSNFIETNQEQNPWVKGVTQGSLYKMPEESRSTLLKSIVASTNASKRKTLEWVHVALQTETNIKKIAQAILWTMNDAAQVASESNQLLIVNIQRENTLWKVYCCQIIRKVTKSLIKNSLEVVRGRLDPLNGLQMAALDEIGSYFLQHYSIFKKKFESDIQKAEEKSITLRLRFYAKVKNLLQNPSRYLAMEARDQAKYLVEIASEKVMDFPNIPLSKIREIEVVRDLAMQTLNALNCSGSEEIERQCIAIVNHVNRVAIDIILPYHTHWTSGHCKDKAA